MLKLKVFISYSIITLALLFSPSGLTVDKNQEYRLKAGFLYNFARFGHWQTPDNQREAFTICSPDQHFIEVAESTLKDRAIKGLPLTTKYVLFNQTALKPCDIIFITTDTLTDWENAQDVSYHNIMVIGETKAFIENGGHIRFFLTGGKIRFEIAPFRLQEAGISMSSKVLRLARIIER